MQETCRSYGGTGVCDATSKSRNLEVVTNMPEGIEKFTNNLYKCIVSDRKTVGNVVVSGLSAHMALSLCSLGAKGDTADQMHKVLCHPQYVHFNDYKEIIQHLNSFKSVTIGIVNKICSDRSITVKESFKNCVSSSFNSSLEMVDFINNTEEAVRSINDICVKATNGKIKDIVSLDDITPLTQLIIVNAIYFKATWLKIFNACFTSKKPFYIDINTTVDVLTMHLTYPFVCKNLDHLSAQCIAIPYEDIEFLFIVILPNKIDGLEALEAKIDNVQFNYKEDFRQDCGDYVCLSLPKFKIESDITMTDYLQNLGMKQAFSKSSADFKGISEKPILMPPLHIDTVIQKAFIEVDENGTEAGTATFSQMKGGGNPGHFIVDRPFLYRIVNVKYNLTLFSGRVVKPEYN